MQVFIAFQHYHVTQRLLGTTVFGSKTKSIRARLRRPKLQDQDQDRGRSETSLVIRPRSQTPRLSVTQCVYSVQRTPEVVAPENIRFLGLVPSMASAGARACNGGPRAEPSAGVQGAEPPEADGILVLEHTFLRSPEGS